MEIEKVLRLEPEPLGTAHLAQWENMNVPPANDVEAPELVLLGRTAAVVAAARGLPGENYLCREVAAALDVSPATIRRVACASSDLAPSAEVTVGMMRVPVYDAATIGRIAEFLAARPGQGGGRPRLWDDSTRRARRAAFSAAGYRRRRAQQLRRRGHVADAVAFEAAAEAILTRLRADHTRQSAIVTRERRG